MSSRAARCSGLRSRAGSSPEHACSSRTSPRATSTRDTETKFWGCSTKCGAGGGRSDLVVVGARGVPLDAIERLRFLWRIGSFAPLVSGSAVLEDGTGEVVSILGTDYGAEGAVREMRLVAPATGAERARLLSSGTVLLPISFASRHGFRIGSRIPLSTGGVRTQVTVGGLLALSGL